MPVTLKSTARIIHNSWHILDVDDAAAEMFRCDRDALIGLALLDLVWSEDFRGLVLLRMRLLREQGKVPPVEYPFHRFDGTRFYGYTTTERIADERYRSIIEFKYDVRGSGSAG